jgi:hypothetical protein
MVMEFLASVGYYGGGAIEQFLNEMEYAGMFTYLLPFLLIFALVNAILTRTNIFQGQKGINAIIALVVGFMALQFDFVPRFFSEIFPRLGIGLAIILVILIIMSLFTDPDESGIMWTMFGIAAIILVVVLVQTAGALGWSAGYWWYDNWKMVAGVVFILILFAIAATAGSTKRSSKAAYAEGLRLVGGGKPKRE